MRAGTKFESFGGVYEQINITCTIKKMKLLSTYNIFAKQKHLINRLALLFI